MTAPLMTDPQPAAPTTRVPTGEKWYYTSRQELDDLYQRAVPVPKASVPMSLVELLSELSDGPRFVYVNGLADAGLGWQSAPDGVEVLPGGLRVGPGVHVDTPLQIVYVTVPGDQLGLSCPRLDIEVGEGARVSLVEIYFCMPGEAITTATTTLSVGRGASAELTRLQVATSEAVHVGSTQIHLGADAKAGMTALSLGGRLARHELEVILGEQGACFDLRGLYAPIGTQRQDMVVTVDHVASRTISRQNVRGVIDDRGRGSFTGHVIVREGTAGVDARQSNRNLVLVPTAEADTRPWLEINADDVKCAHGATVGRLDADALFYLRSRGIPVAEARELLIDAFMAEVLVEVKGPRLRAQLDGLLLRHRAEAGQA